MTKKPKSEVEGDSQRGDAILKRMLQTKPKQHKDMLKERRRRVAKDRKPKK
jgi:hypothetical protein